MHIALLSEGLYPFKVGGIQKHSYLLAKFLARRKIAVDVYFYADQELSTYDIHQGFTDSELDYLAFFVYPYPKYPVYFPGHFVYESWKVSKKISEDVICRRDLYDFIYVKGLVGLSLFRRAGKLSNFPQIGIKFHGYEMFQKPSSFRSRIESYFLRPPTIYSNRKADFVFSYGGKITDIIVTRLRISRDTIYEIPSGIEPERIDVLPSAIGNPRKLLFIGRFERRKGVQELNLALVRLLPYSSFEFHFIGPIPPEHKIDSPNIIYHGLIRDVAQVKAIINSADILITPSHSEGMPNVILEGMAGGCAIIATDVGAVSSMVSEKNGWLIPSPDPILIANAIEDGLKISADALLQKKNQSLQLVREQFTWESVAAMVEEAIRESISRKSASINY